MCKLCGSKYLAVPKDLYEKVKQIPANWLSHAAESYEKIAAGCACSRPELSPGEYVIVDQNFAQVLEGEIEGSGWLSPRRGKKRVASFVLEGGFVAGLLSGQGRISEEVLSSDQRVETRELFSGAFSEGKPHGVCRSALCPDCEHGNLWYKGMHVLEADELDILDGVIALPKKQSVKFMTFALINGQQHGPYVLQGVFDPQLNEFRRTRVTDEDQDVAFGDFVVDFAPDLFAWVDFVPVGGYELLSDDGNVRARLDETQDSVRVEYIKGAFSVPDNRLLNLDQLLGLRKGKASDPVQWLPLYVGGVEVERHGHFPWESDIIFEGECKWYLGSGSVKFEGTTARNKPSRGKMFGVNMLRFVEGSPDFADCVLDCEFDDGLLPVGLSTLETAGGKKMQCVWSRDSGKPVPKFI